MKSPIVFAGTLLAAFFATSVGRAAPIGYVINFNFNGSSALPPSAQDPILPTSGSFTYDSATDTFSNFHVLWNGLNFDMTGSANNPLDFYSPSCLNGLTDGAASFAFLEGSCNPPQGGGSTVWIVGRLQESPTFEFLSSDPSKGQGGVSALIDINDTVGGSPLALPSLGGWTVTQQVASTPEPGGLALSVLAMGMLVMVRRRISRPINR